MPTYIGFSTQNVNQPRTLGIQPGVTGGTSYVNRSTGTGRKFTLTDDDLIITDFINALNIPQGQKPGMPQYGTTLWSFLFEPNTADVQAQIEAEVRRLANLDPRLLLNTVIVYSYESGILIEVELATSATNEVNTIKINFDQNTNTARLV
jgi:phage baseplate assembly protein W